MVLNAAFNKSIYANEMNFSLIVQIKMISLTMIHCDLYNILRQIKKKNENHHHKRTIQCCAVQCAQNNCTVL